MPCPAKISRLPVFGLSSISNQPGQDVPLQGVPAYCQIERSVCCWYSALPATIHPVRLLSSISSQPGQVPLQAGPINCQTEPSLCIWSSAVAPAAKVPRVVGLSSISTQPGQEPPLQGVPVYWKNPPSLPLVP